MIPEIPVLISYLQVAVLALPLPEDLILVFGEVFGLQRIMEQWVKLQFRNIIPPWDLMLMILMVMRMEKLILR
jgi:hypothetical protein